MGVRFSGMSNKELIDHLIADGVLADANAERAMRQTDRGHYCPYDAYADHPVPIGHSATISAPHMHAHALTTLKDYLRPGMRVLDVGCGSGYLSTCMARMVAGGGGGGSDPQQQGGIVIAIDYLPPLVALSQGNVAKADQDLVTAGTLTILQGDGWKGHPAAAPFDAIHVGAAAASMPDALVAQLKAPGRMVIPVGTGAQRFMQVDRDASGRVTTKTLFGVRYVPLVKLS